jgi:hypothetical protein
MKQVGDAWGISDHPKAKIQKLFAKLGIKDMDVRKLVGKEVKVKVETKDINTPQEKQYLRFYY